MSHGCDGFFKVMLDDFADTLQIPPRFVRTVIRQQQWDAVKLRSSLGKTWTVELQDDANGCWCFRSGWGDFVRGHDIRFGYILLFDYSGNMGFFVRVYDHSACVIRYAPSITNRNRVVLVDDDDDDAGQGEDCKIPVKQEEEENVTHEQSQREDEPQLHSSGKPKFRVKMRARGLLRETSMHIIPTSFMDSNNLTSIRKATLSNSAGTWTVNVRHRFQNKRKCNVFGHGWLTYFKDNKLKAGDVCIFELVSARKSEAHFFVTTEQDLIRTSSKSKEEAVQEIDCFLGQSTSSPCPSSTKRPYFTVVINKCHLSRSNGYLHIPAAFNAWDYLSNQPCVTVMDTNGKSWKMDVCLNCWNNRKYIRLGSGWLKFCHDRKLNVGDACTFELTTDGEKAKMIVNIQKKQLTQSSNVKNKETSVDITGDKNMDGVIDVETWEQQNDVRRKRGNEKQPSCRRYPKRQKVAHAKSSSMEDQIQSELSENPHFIVTLNPYNVRHGFGSQLNVPTHFNGRKFFSENCKVKLLNARGESWVVNVCLNRVRIRFGSGWYLFASDNGLKVGDICRVTLINEKEVVMRLDVLAEEKTLNE